MLTVQVSHDCLLALQIDLVVIFSHLARFHRFSTAPMVFVVRGMMDKQRGDHRPVAAHDLPRWGARAEKQSKSPGGSDERRGYCTVHSDVRPDCESYGWRRLLTRPSCPQFVDVVRSKEG